jgi:hypothetical protein
MAVLGLPADRFLYTRDREERLLLLALAEAAVRAHDTMQRNLATRIGNAIAKAWR